MDISSRQQAQILGNTPYILRHHCRLNQAPWIIGNLAEYNDYNIVGAWYSMAKLISGVRYTDGNPDDEHFIGDHEFMPQILEVEQYTSVPWLIDIAKTRAGAVLFSTDWHELQHNIESLRSEAFFYYDDESAVMDAISELMDDYEVSQWFNNQDWTDSLSSARVALSDYDQTADWHVVDNLNHVADSSINDTISTVITAMQQALLDAAEEELQED